MDAEEPMGTLEDRVVNVKVKLALLWVGLMFFYIYNDVFSLQQPGHLEELIEGELQGVEINQGILFGGAMLMALPSFMILLSLVLRARPNRMANVIVGSFHIVLLVATQFVGQGDVWLYWRTMELFELLFLALIVWTAWTWPTTDHWRQQAPVSEDAVRA